MIVLLSEISKCLNKKLQIETVSESLTMIGLEVESIREVSLSSLDPHIVVGNIKKIVKHPNADKLQLCEVDSGEGALDIVCGANNIKVGDNVPLAKIGAKLSKSEKLPNGLNIKKSKIREVESYGMLCSSSELGLGYEYEDGIFILPADLNPGEVISKISDLNDFIIDISVTPNRGDCLSVFGICRELSALLDCDFINPMNEFKGNYKNVNKIDELFVNIEGPETLRYSLKKLNNIKVGPSPFWLKNFLAKMNVSSINNIVDASNLFMLLTGHPIHTFDFDQIVGKQISVNTSATGKMEALNNESKKIDGHIVVSDESGPIALAGIIGAKRGSVNNNTKNILIECASFNPSKIRNSSKSLNISTESSYRFERHVSEFCVKNALFYATELIQSICSGDLDEDYLDTHPQLENKREIILDLNKVPKVLGLNIEEEKIIKILNSLSIKLNINKSKDGTFRTFDVPDFRFDLESEQDLIEEVARINGFDSIEPVLPNLSIREKLRSPLSNTRNIVISAKESFSQDGYSEVVNFSFTDDELFHELTKVEILNPISQDSKFLRSSLIPSLLKNASYNLNHGNNRFKLFEVGNVFSIEDKKISQAMQVSTICTSDEKNLLWNKNNFDFYDKKKSIENFLSFLNISSKDLLYSVNIESIYSPILHPGKSAIISYDKKEIGFVGEIHPEILAEYNIKKGLVVSTIFLSEISIIDIKPKTLKSFSNFPFVQRDVSILIDKNIEGMHVVNLIDQYKSELVKEAYIFDVFENSKIGIEKKSLSISMLFGADDRTLEDREVAEELEKILSDIGKKIPLEIRD